MKEGKDFFISYTGKDREWAEWIAWHLEDAGYSTLIQAWDFHAASNFVLKMQQGVANSIRTIAIISPDYFESVFTNPEWENAFAKDPLSENGKLIPIRVTNFEPPGLFKAIVYIDLVGIGEFKAKEQLIKSIENIVVGKRLKPDFKPTFPGGQSASASPPFPGASATLKPFLHNLPFASNPYFTGREKMLQDLRDALRKNSVAAITQPQAVHGLGGVGKTQLAIEYAWQHPADYDVVLWVASSSPAELHINIAELADVLRLQEANSKEQDLKIKAVMEWLRSNRRWLLIFDNADSKDAEIAVAKILPVGLQGHILVTSRRSDWPVNFADLEVSVLPEPAARDFLLKRAQKGDFKAGHDADAMAVAIELGCLPLALEQAAAYVLKHRTNFLEYKKSLEKSRRKLLEFPSQGGTGYQQTVATTWLITESQLSDIAIAILQLASFFSPFDIPREIFTNTGEQFLNAIEELLKVSHEQLGTELLPERIEEALAELHEHSLIKLESDFFSCHRLLQAVLLDRLDPQSKNKWLMAATLLLADAAKSKPPKPANWPLWVRLRPRCLHEQGIADQNQSYLVEAELLYRRAMTIDESIFGNQHPMYARDANNLGWLLHDIGKFDAAEVLFRQSLKIEMSTRGENHPSVATVLGNLGRTLTSKGHFDEAVNLFERALAISTALLGRVNHKNAIHLTNLAFALIGCRRFSEAEKCYQEALEIDEKCFGAKHNEVGHDLFNLAGFLIQQGRYLEAEGFLRRAYNIFKQTLGKDHLRTHETLDALEKLKAVRAFESLFKKS